MRGGDTPKPGGTVGNFDKSTVQKASLTNESREAWSHLTKFRTGDHVVVTNEQGKETIAKVTATGNADGSYGSFESFHVNANIRPGGYTYVVRNSHLTTGHMNIRHATPAEARKWERDYGAYDMPKAEKPLTLEVELQETGRGYGIVHKAGCKDLHDPLPIGKAYDRDEAARNLESQTGWDVTNHRDVRFAPCVSLPKPKVKG